jgi:hypothetical protein
MDPESPKTYGFYRSGSSTLVFRLFVAIKRENNNK